MNAATFPAAKANGMTVRLSREITRTTVLNSRSWPC